MTIHGDCIESRHRDIRRISRVLLASVLTLLVGYQLAPPAARGETEGDIFEMSLDELGRLDIEVTSVSKKAQEMSSAAAAIAVITGEEIRRSGATSIPEALRLVPGVQVSRMDASRWAVTARGFDGEFADKLLVLIDGRSVYSPLFGGVYWDVQDTLLEDIDRIEVIRGPGATVWGANAVNGVINIITKHADQTHGRYVTVSGGNEMEFTGGFRWGDQVGENFHYRAYGKYKQWDEFTMPLTGADAGDEWRQGHGGFRMDWAPGEGRSFTFQGDYYNGSTSRSSIRTDIMLDDSVVGTDFVKTVTSGKSDQAGGNLLGRYSHDIGEASNATIQTYWDRTIRRGPMNDEVRDTLDLEFQNNFPLPGDVEVIWGFGYRVLWGETENNTFNMSLIPPSRTDHLATGFIQADWLLIPDRVVLTAGSKFEYNSYTGFEWQPSVRAAYTPGETHTFWAAGSRAVHTPTWIDEDLAFLISSTAAGDPLPNGATLPSPLAVRLFGRDAARLAGVTVGGEDRKSEVLYAVEGGYRFKGEELALDVAGYWNRYNRVRNAAMDFSAMSMPAGKSYFLVPILILNGIQGWTAGFDALVSWRAHERVHLSTYYSFIHTDLEVYAGNVIELSGRVVDPGDAGPKHQWHVRAALDLPANVEYDTLVWYIDEVANSAADAFWRWDMRLGYSPVDRLQLDFVVQNLLEKGHKELSSEVESGADIPRTYFFRATIEF